jgi:hypothetical protein
LAGWVKLMWGRVGMDGFSYHDPGTQSGGLRLASLAGSPDGTQDVSAVSALHRTL